MKLALILALVAGPVAAQQNCLPHDQLTALLAEKYAEARIGMGMDNRGFAAELFLSEAGTWTMVYTDPTGKSCIVGAGGGFSLAPEALPPNG